MARHHRHQTASSRVQQAFAAEGGPRLLRAGLALFGALTCFCHCSPPIVALATREHSVGSSQRYAPAVATQFCDTADRYVLCA